MSQIYAGAQQFELGGFGPVMRGTVSVTAGEARTATTKLYEKLLNNYGLDIDFMLVTKDADFEDEWREYDGKA